MSLPVFLDATYAGMIDDIAPPMARVEARQKVDEILDTEPPSRENWGKTPQQIAERIAAEKMFGGSR